MGLSVGVGEADALQMDCESSKQAYTCHISAHFQLLVSFFLSFFLSVFLPVFHFSLALSCDPVRQPWEALHALAGPTVVTITAL